MKFYFKLFLLVSMSMSFAFFIKLDNIYFVSGGNLKLVLASLIFVGLTWMFSAYSLGVLIEKHREFASTDILSRKGLLPAHVINIYAIMFYGPVIISWFTIFWTDLLVNIFLPTTTLDFINIILAFILITILYVIQTKYGRIMTRIRETTAYGKVFFSSFLVVVLAIIILFDTDDSLKKVAAESDAATVLPFFSTLIIFYLAFRGIVLVFLDKDHFLNDKISYQYLTTMAIAGAMIIYILMIVVMNYFVAPETIAAAGDQYIIKLFEVIFPDLITAIFLTLLLFVGLGSITEMMYQGEVFATMILKNRWIPTTKKIRKSKTNQYPMAIVYVAIITWLIIYYVQNATKYFNSVKFEEIALSMFALGFVFILGAVIVYAIYFKYKRIELIIVSLLGMIGSLVVFVSFVVTTDPKNSLVLLIEIIIASSIVGITILYNKWKGIE